MLRGRFILGHWHSVYIVLITVKTLETAHSSRWWMERLTVITYRFSLFSPPPLMWQEYHLRIASSCLNIHCLFKIFLSWQQWISQQAFWTVSCLVAWIHLFQGVENDNTNTLLRDFFMSVWISENQLCQSLLYCQFCHMYRTYIQRIEIALLSDPWCIQITLNTNSRM